MLNKSVKRLLQVSIIVSAVSLTTVLMQPADTRLAAQSLVAAPTMSTSIESTCILKSDETDVKLPASYSKDNAYPALIVLPYTGGTPANYFQGSFAEQYEIRTENPFIVILFDIEGSENDPENFDSAIERCENLVATELEKLSPEYNIDQSRIALAGSSLGGDLAWALSLRNPGIFKGTIIINSQCTKRVDELNMNQLSAQDSRFFMAWSVGDEKNRLPQMREAVNLLTRYHIAHRFEIVPTRSTDPERGHSSSELWTERLMSGVDYVLFETE